MPVQRSPTTGRFAPHRTNMEQTPNVNPNRTVRLDGLPANISAARRNQTRNLSDAGAPDDEEDEEDDGGETTFHNADTADREAPNDTLEEAV